MALIVLFISFIIQQVSAVEQTGAENFLDIFPRSVRALGLGGVVAAPTFPSTAENNETGALPQGNRFSFSSMHAPLPFGDALYFVGSGTEAAGIGLFLSWFQVSSRNVEITAVDSITAADTVAFRTLGTLDEYENLVTLTAGRAFLGRIKAGLSAKYFYIKMGEYAGHGYGFDLACSFADIVDRLSLGFLLKNAVPGKIHFNKLGDESLAPSLRLGASYHTWNERLGFYLDVKRVLKPQYLEACFLGAEYRPLPFIAFRAGLSEWTRKSAGPICLGAGILVRNIGFDYAFNGDRETGYTGGHRIGVSYRIPYPERSER